MYEINWSAQQVIDELYLTAPISEFADIPSPLIVYDINEFYWITPTGVRRTFTANNTCYAFMFKDRTAQNPIGVFFYSPNQDVVVTRNDGVTYQLNLNYCSGVGGYQSVWASDYRGYIIYEFLGDIQTLNVNQFSGYLIPAPTFAVLINATYSSDTDPFAPGGGNDGGGGTGNFDNTSDTISVPSLPSVSITDSGFLTLFATNQAGLRSLSNYLWSDLFSAIAPGGTLEETITTLKKVVANPYDAILGCSLVPVTVPTGGSKDVKLYGVLNSGVTLPVASSQYVSVDCGTLNINEYWGAYLDYAPYTKVTSLYLPYVGVVSIDTDLIMGKALQVIYHVDILSGQCVAYIVINGSVEFQYMGHCATPIPVTSIDYSSTIQAGLGLVGSIANIAGSAVGGALGGGAVGALTGGASSLMGQAGSMAQNVMNSKPDIKSGSGIGGMGGMMSVQKPFLIIERPRQSLPKKGDLSQNHWTGYPSNMAKKLGDLSGYTEVAKIFVNRTTATAEEKEEITRLLTEGVYI